MKIITVPNHSRSSRLFGMGVDKFFCVISHLHLRRLYHDLAKKTAQFRLNLVRSLYVFEPALGGLPPGSNLPLPTGQGRLFGAAILPFSPAQWLRLPAGL